MIWTVKDGEGLHGVWDEFQRTGLDQPDRRRCSAKGCT